MSVPQSIESKPSPKCSATTTLPGVPRHALSLARLVARVAPTLPLAWLDLDGVSLPAALVPHDQLWFHHPEMQRRTQKAESDIAEGRTSVTRTLAAAQAELDRHNSGARRQRPKAKRHPVRAATWRTHATA